MDHVSGTYYEVTCDFIKMEREEDVNKSYNPTIKKIIESYKEEFNKRNVDIEYIVSTDFKAELYGYDGGLKKTITKMEEIKELFTEIDNMPSSDIV